MLWLPTSVHSASYYNTLTLLLLHGAILTTMGSPVSVTIDNLVMEEVKQNALTTYNFTHPIFWKIYVCTALPVDLVDDLLIHLNFIEQSINITVK